MRGSVLIVLSASSKQYEFKASLFVWLVSLISFSSVSKLFKLSQFSGISTLKKELLTFLILSFIKDISALLAALKRLFNLSLSDTVLAIFSKFFLNDSFTLKFLFYDVEKEHSKFDTCEKWNKRKEDHKICY